MNNSENYQKIVELSLEKPVTSNRIFPNKTVPNLVISSK